MPKGPKRWVYRFLLTFFPLLISPGVAQAHREDYLDETLVYLTLQRGELEPEYWLDFVKNSDANLYFMRHNLALEYGITNRWMIEARTTFSGERGSGFGFESGRLESRYRFSEEGRLPIDIAISVEINTPPAENGLRQAALEPRLILSKDVGKLNLTFNFAQEIPLHSGTASFDPSFGLRYDASRLLRFGSEVKYNTDIGGGSVIPQVWFTLPHGVTLKVGFAFQFAHNRNDFGRAAIEKDF